MSESSSELGAAGRERSVDELVERLRTKTLAERLPLSAHLSIGRTLCKLRDAITSDKPVSIKAGKALLCCGISMYRRHAVGEKAEEEGDDHEETMNLVKQSSVLIFVLLACIEARSGSAVDVDAARDVVERANAATLARVLEVREPASRKRKQPPADEEAVEGEEGEAQAVAAALPQSIVSAGTVTMALLRYVAHTLRDRASTEHERFADMFFRTSAACMAQNLLLAHGANDFVSLKAAADNPVPREKRLLGIAQAGESEAGQSVLRDILLSFLLPGGTVGVRRNLLLSRAASTAAGVDHAAAVNQAHSVAMAGCEFIWQHGTDPLERACALLAGAAVLVTKGGEDPIRKQDAFVGRVSLPFFETMPPATGVKRLALLTDQSRWVLYKTDKKNRPHVLCNLSGFEGLCDCLLEFF